ncbi:MAG: hypothetical protein ACTMKW_09555 [Brevibacterium aurantiacum]
MACACGKKSGMAKTYLHVSKDGTQKSYSSEVEALAAQRRLGGTVRPK